MTNELDNLLARMDELLARLYAAVLRFLDALLVTLTSEGVR